MSDKTEQFITKVYNSQMVVSSNPREILKSSALGSNLCVSVFDPDAAVGGMIQCMLPNSHISPGIAAGTPAMFVDTGVSRLLEELYSLRARKKKIVIKAAGCADIMDTEKSYQVGKRNYLVLKKFLWKEGMIVNKEATGGVMSRALKLEIKTGKTFLITQGKEVEL